MVLILYFCETQQVTNIVVSIIRNEDLLEIKKFQKLAVMIRRKKVDTHRPDHMRKPTEDIVNRRHFLGIRKTYEIYVEAQRKKMAKIADFHQNRVR